MTKEPTPVERAALLSQKGAEFHAKGQVEAARLHYIAAVSLDPQSDYLQNLSGALYALDHFEAAASVGRRSVAANGSNPYAHANLALAMIALGETDVAKAHMRLAIGILPTFASFYHNLGQCYYRENDHLSAVETFDKSLELAPGVRDVLNDRALALLALGNLSDGLAAYEIRWKTLFQSKSWELGAPEWKGEDLTGKHILLHHEQGFGDTIMLSRFINRVRSRAAKVSLAMPPELAALMKRNFPKCPIVDWIEPKVENVDFHSPLLSTMRHLGKETKNINPVPYLHSGPLSIPLPKTKTKIGICWASGEHGARLRRRRRVVPLELFLPLSEIPGVSLVSLQKGAGTEHDIPNLGMEGIIFDSMARCTDFAATASVISALDLVIAVDSAVAHLAGAIGKPTIMLGPWTRCWRWWGETNGLPWYRNFRIVSQARDGSWNETLETVTNLVLHAPLRRAA